MYSPTFAATAAWPMRKCPDYQIRECRVSNYKKYPVPYCLFLFSCHYRLYICLMSVLRNYHVAVSNVKVESPRVGVLMDLKPYMERRIQVGRVLGSDGDQLLHHIFQ